MSRESIHEKIDELLGLIGVQNDRLSLRIEKISQLDIDVLRKQCIELYDQVNKLALTGKLVSNIPVSNDVQKEPTKAKQEPKFVPEIEPPKLEPQMESEPKYIEPQLTQKPQPPKKQNKPTTPKPVKAKGGQEAEMLSLFEKFNNKPIDSIPRAISVAKRFEFQSEFFDGDPKSYKEFMSSIDEAEDREAAFAIYHEAKDRLAWENEDLKDELKALMYRKHLN